MSKLKRTRQTSLGSMDKNILKHTRALSKEHLAQKEILEFINTISQDFSNLKRKTNALSRSLDTEKKSVENLQDLLKNYDAERLESLANVLDHAPASIALIDAEYRYKFVNKKYLEWYRQKRDAFLGKTLHETFGKFMNIDALVNNLDIALKGTSHQIVNKAINLDGNLLYYSTTYAPSYSVTGEINGVYIYALDITEIKENEQKVIESEELFRTMLESSPVGISIIDQMGNTVRHSESGANVFGYSLENDVKTNSLQTFIHPDSFKDAFDDLEKIFGKKLPKISNTYKCVKQSGEIIYCDFKASLLESGTYKDHAIIGFTDVTEKTLAKIELENKNQKLKEYIESNIKLEQFAHIASHDLKSPLRTVSSFTGLLKSKLKERIDEKEMEYLDYIENGAKKMSELINDLLDYSTANAQTLKLQEFTPKNAMIEVLSNLTFLLTESNADVNAENFENSIIADKGKFKQILQNLITNGIKFIPKDAKPTINLQMEENDEFWVFAVKDNGIGINEKNQVKIFDAFSRLHTQKEYEGTGLGLSICFTLVDKHKGDIWVDSTVGVGSTFYFSIKKGLETTQS